MSKAFTRESDESGAVEIRSVRHQLPSAARNYITRTGADRLKRQLDELLEQKRGLEAKGPDVEPASVAMRQEVEARIRIQQQALDSVVVAEMPADRGKVAFGATVKVRYVNGAEESYQIVGVEEAEPESGCISWISPLARALLSRRAGENVRFKSPAGPEELMILSVHY